MEKEITDFLAFVGLLDKADFGNTDEAKNVCDYPSQGHTNSASAKIKQKLQLVGRPYVSWWCLPHRFNLAFGDVLKKLNLREFVTWLRTTIAYCKTSAQKYAAIEASVKQSQQHLEAMAAAVDELEQRILDIEGNEDDESKTEAEKLVTKLRDGRLSRDELAAQLKALGRSRRLKGYLVVRWLSLFLSVDSVLDLWPWLHKLFKEIIDKGPPKPSKKGKNKQGDGVAQEPVAEDQEVDAAEEVVSGGRFP